MKKIIKHLIRETVDLPGNPILPLLYYKEAIDLKGKNGAETIKKIFKSNHWFKPWVNGIYDFHHYHSNNHEVLGIAAGSCKVQFGGDKGIIIDVERGDVIIIPAGVAHKSLEKSNGFSCVGAYALNVDYDMCEKKCSLQKIISLPLPESDPVFGEDGPLIKHWKREAAEQNPL